MLKFYNYDIVCQEIPDEVTLALNITGCPNRCEGCHSPWLRENVGEVLCGPAADGSGEDFSGLDTVVGNYASCVTCVCFMGGDNSPEEVELCAIRVRKLWPKLKTGWYSGKDCLPAGVDRKNFNYVKLGPYIAACGGLRSPNTNQRLYRIGPSGEMELIHVHDPHKGGVLGAE